MGAGGRRRPAGAVPLERHPAALHRRHGRGLSARSAGGLAPAPRLPARHGDAADHRAVLRAAGPARPRAAAGRDRAGGGARCQAAGLFRRAPRPPAAPGRAAGEPERGRGRLGRGPGLALRPAGAELCRHGADQRRPVQPRRAQPVLAGVHHADRHLLPAARLGPDGGGGPQRGAAAASPHGTASGQGGGSGAGRLPARPGDGLPVPRLPSTRWG